MYNLYILENIFIFTEKHCSIICYNCIILCLASIYNIEEICLAFKYNIAFFMVDGVMTVEWSTSSEWVLVTGGCDGAIRFWDIRRAGCFLLLDQSHSQLGRRPTIPEHSATNKVFLMPFLFEKKSLLYYFFFANSCPL
jgi:WD40 repeat protein